MTSNFDTTHLRWNSMPAANMQLSEILKTGGLVVNQTVVSRMLSGCVQAKKNATQESGRNFFYFVAKNCVNSCAFNPPFLKLRQALMRYRQLFGDTANIEHLSFERTDNYNNS